jgi:hypothetical protein
MKKLTLAAATTAIAVAAPGVLVAPAEAHCGANHGFPAYRFSGPTNYSRPPKPLARPQVRAAPPTRPAVAANPVEKAAPTQATTEKAAPEQAAAEKAPPKQAAVEKAPPKQAAEAGKYLDAQGRQFDQVSKVWFDGKSECWQGAQAFTFRDDAWFYGNARWVQTNNGWGVSSGTLPQPVSCQGIQAFAAKLPADQARPKATAVTTGSTQVSPPPVQAAPVPPAPEYFAASGTPPAAARPEAPAKVCKEYFPAVGEMVTVPCAK